MRKQRRGTRSWRGQRQESSPGLLVSRARLRPRQPHLSPGLTIWASGGASPGQGPTGSTGTAEGETQRRAPAERRAPELPTPTDGRRCRQEPPAAQWGPHQLCSGGLWATRACLTASRHLSREQCPSHTHAGDTYTRVCTHEKVNEKTESCSLSPGGGITPGPGLTHRSP